MDSVFTDWLVQPDGLAMRLRLLRVQAGLSGKALADVARWPASKVSRLENGKQLPKVEDLAIWTEACMATADQQRELLDLLQQVHARQIDWKQRMRRGQVPVQNSYYELLAETQRIRNFETALVPGILQVPEYAKRMLQEMVTLHGLSVDDVDAAVMSRMRRQQLLYESGRNFELLIFEPALLWLRGSSSVMSAQLDRILTVIGMPNVRLGIIPLGVELAMAPQNSFQIYDDRFVIVESFVGETLYEGDKVAAYADVMEGLWRDAAMGDDARRLIMRASARLQEEASRRPGGEP